MFSLITDCGLNSRSKIATRTRRLRGFHGLSVSPANFSKPASLEDRVDCRGETIVALGKPLLHLREERVVRELKTATEGITQKFATELVNKGVATSHGQVISQTCQ